MQSQRNMKSQEKDTFTAVLQRVVDQEQFDVHVVLPQMHKKIHKHIPDK